MEVLIQDKQLHIETTSSSSSSPSSPLVSPPYTPSFQPNSFEASYAKANQAKPIDVSLDQFDLNDLGAELDLGDSISKLLRVGTQRAHVNAEHSKGAEKLLKGELGLQEYVRWLAILWRVYDALELGLSAHSSNNVLEPTYNPAMLARAGPLANDITYLLAQLPSDQVTSPVTTTPSGPLPPFPLPPFLAELWTHPEPALQTYLSHIKDLSSSSKSSPRLLAHAYVRYLGDLSGGQFIAARLRKTYELGEAGGKGLEFYHFNLDHGPEALAEESRADKKKRLEEIKDWYRKGMDEGVGEDSDLKVTLVKEANLAFILNTHLFSLIRADGPPPSTVKLTPASQSQSLVGAGQQLRYFETRELARLEKQKEQERLNPPKPPLRWYEIAERTALFTATVVLGWGLSTYGMPWITENAGKYLGSGSSLSGEL